MNPILVGLLILLPYIALHVLPRWKWAFSDQDETPAKLSRNTFIFKFGKKVGILDHDDSKQLYKWGWRLSVVVLGGITQLIFIAIHSIYINIMYSADYIPLYINKYDSIFNMVTEPMLMLITYIVALFIGLPYLIRRSTWSIRNVNRRSVYEKLKT